MAEGILQARAKAQGLAWEVDSAGTEAYHIGSPPHPLSQKVCALHDYDLSYQRARQVKPDDLDYYDRIFVMAQDVYHRLAQQMGDHPHWNKVDYFLHLLEPGSQGNVPDPWYGDESGYHEVFALIHQGCEALLAQYDQQAQAPVRSQKSGQ